MDSIHNSSLRDRSILRASLHKTLRKWARSKGNKDRRQTSGRCLLNTFNKEASKGHRRTLGKCHLNILNTPNNKASRAHRKISGRHHLISGTNKARSPTEPMATADRPLKPAQLSL